MLRAPRSVLGDGIFHVTARGNARQAIFTDDADRRGFLLLLSGVAERHRWECHAYCLMLNHYHLVVECPLEALSQGMRRLNGGYAQHYNSRHDRTGHLFQGRYDARLIEDERQYEEVCRYVVENPVHAGLCDDVDDWPWASLLLRT